MKSLWVTMIRNMEWFLGKKSLIKKIELQKRWVFKKFSSRKKIRRSNKINKTEKPLIWEKKASSKRNIKDLRQTSGTKDQIKAHKFSPSLTILTSCKSQLSLKTSKKSHWTIIKFHWTIIKSHWTIIRSQWIIIINTWAKKTQKRQDSIQRITRMSQRHCYISKKCLKLWNVNRHKSANLSRNRLTGKGS